MDREIIIRVEAPTDCTEAEFKQWVEYCLGYCGGVSLENPLSEYDLEAKYVEIR